jgi:hypothetical protein
MNQSDLNREIAKATGESVSLIKELGFTEVIVPQSFRVSSTDKTPPPAEPGLAPFPAEDRDGL